MLYSSSSEYKQVKNNPLHRSLSLVEEITTSLLRLDNSNAQIKGKEDPWLCLYKYGWRIPFHVNSIGGRNIELHVALLNMSLGIYSLDHKTYGVFLCIWVIPNYQFSVEILLFVLIKRVG